jgi:hypothetical protein
MVFYKLNFDQGKKPDSKSIQLVNRCFQLKDLKNKTSDTVEFLPGNNYHLSDFNNGDLENYNLIRINDYQYLDLLSDDYSLLEIIEVSKNEIKLLSRVYGTDTLILSELPLKKKYSLNNSKWKLLNPSDPKTVVSIQFKDSLLSAQSDKTVLNNRIFISYDERYIYTLPFDYSKTRNENGVISPFTYCIYQIHKRTDTDLYLYNHNRGNVNDPLICGREFELRLVKTK